MSVPFIKERTGKKSKLLHLYTYLDSIHLQKIVIIILPKAYIGKFLHKGDSPAIQSLIITAPKDQAYYTSIYNISRNSKDNQNRKNRIIIHFQRIAENAHVHEKEGGSTQ
jgi:hypothetical protein